MKELEKLKLIAEDVDFNNILIILEGLRGLSRTMQENDFLLYLIKPVKNLKQALCELKKKVGVVQKQTIIHR